MWSLFCNHKCLHKLSINLFYFIHSNVFDEELDYEMDDHNEEQLLQSDEGN